jgi:hypothetical protein
LINAQYNAGYEKENDPYKSVGRPIKHVGKIAKREENSRLE